MFTQLSLFDLPYQFDSVASSSAIHSVSPPSQAGVVAMSTRQGTTAAEPAMRLETTRSEAMPMDIRSQRSGSVQPMGELARLVLARYDLMARRREALARRRAENPRKSIRVLSPR